MKIKKISEVIPEIQEHVVMRDYTSLKVGGVADYFLEVKKIEDLIKAIRTAVDYQIPYFILGGGSNVLFSDYGMPGLVIKNSTANIAVLSERSQLIADSGVALSQLIMASTAHDLSGLEFLYGVPGTVGGALYGNAGAYGSSIGDYAKNITLLKVDPKDGIPKICQYDRKWMDFEYRSSKLKKIKSRHKPIILSVRFQLSHNQKEEIMRKLNAFKKERVSSQPIGLSCGCVFRNPIPKELKNVTGRGSKGMPELPKERRAGYLLDQAGVKKLKIGQAEVSSKHANFIINNDGATASEIRSLIEEMRESVRQKFGITLEEEIEYVGQW